MVISHLYSKFKEIKMKKVEFIKLVKAKGNYNTLDEAEKAIAAFTDAITAALSKRDDVSLIGFGSFVTTLQKGKTGKVPGTDRIYTTEDKYVPKFKAGKKLKDSVGDIKV